MSTGIREKFSAVSPPQLEMTVSDTVTKLGFLVVTGVIGFSDDRGTW